MKYINILFLLMLLCPYEVYKYIIWKWANKVTMIFLIMYNKELLKRLIRLWFCSARPGESDDSSEHAGKLFIIQFQR